MNDASNSTLSQRIGTGENEQVLTHIEEALRGLRYGIVSIIVQDGVVVQVERTEKRRLRSPRQS